MQHRRFNGWESPCGRPATSGFGGEFLIFVGVFQVNTWVAMLGLIGVILGAAYMLWLYRRVIFGELNKESLKSITDLNMREIGFFAPLVALALFMGIYPKPFLDVLHVSVENLVEQSRMARMGGVNVADLMPDVLAKVLR